MAFPLKNNTDKEKMAKLLQSAMQASPARFVPISSSIRSSQKQLKFSAASEKKPWKSNNDSNQQINVEKLKIPLNFVEYKSSGMHQTLVDSGQRSARFSAEDNIQEEQPSFLAPNEKEEKIISWLDNSKHPRDLPTEEVKSEETRRYNLADMYKVQLRDSDFIDTTSYYDTSKSSIESGEITDDSSFLSVLSQATSGKRASVSVNDFPEIKSFTNFTASSALHSTAIDQSMSLNPTFLDPNKTFVPKIDNNARKVNSHSISANHTFAPYRSDKQNSIVKRKDSGYSTTAENVNTLVGNKIDKHVCENEPVNLVPNSENPNNTFKPNHPLENERIMPGSYNLTFASCIECSANIAANSEISAQDPNMTFEPKHITKGENNISGKSLSTASEEDPNITFVPKSMDCCNMTIDEQLGIIHSPTTHKQESNKIEKSNLKNAAKLKSLSPRILHSISPYRQNIQMTKNTGTSTQENTAYINTRKRVNTDIPNGDYVNSIPIAKKHKDLDNVVHSNMSLINPLICSSSLKDNTNAINQINKENISSINFNMDESLEEEIKQKIEDIEKKENVAKWSTVKALLRVICNSDSYLPNSVKYTALQDLMEILHETKFPIMQILHEEKNFIEKIGSLARQENLEACELVLAFLKHFSKDEALQHLPCEIQKQFFSIVHRLIKCKDMRIQIEAKSIFYYITRVM